MTNFSSNRGRLLEAMYGCDPTVSEKLATVLYERQSPVFQELSKYAAEYIMSSLFPNLSAAFSAYQASKDEQDAHEYAMNAAKYPALHSTQPQMLAMQQSVYGGGFGGTASPPVHHRRHRHHHG